MYSRRTVLVGGWCLAAVDPALARRPPEPFLCSTPDVTGSDRPPTREVTGRAALMRAVPDPGKLWRLADGATPGSGLITLDVALLNGSRAAHDAVRRYAADWIRGPLARRIAFRFGQPPSRCPVRVAFDAGGGNWSDIGRDALKKASSGAPTMNLGDVTARSVRHEFGHVLGLHHEHQHPRAGIRWNKPAVYRDTAALGWSRAKTDDNIFGHLSRDCVCVGDSSPDPASVMMYAIPAEWTFGTFVTPNNTTISARDRRCLEREYRA